MIYVTREQAPTDYLDRAEKEYPILRDLVAKGGMRPLAALGTRRWVCQEPAALNRLIEMFSGKCAFCESLIGIWGPAIVEQFRPRSGAIGRSGEFDALHYWWLSLEWRNLYPCCAKCSMHKGSRFPVLGERAALETPYEQLAEQEKALLIDPCFVDPEKEFVYDEDGTIASTNDSGRTTIEIFALNRQELIDERQRAVAMLRQACVMKAIRRIEGKTSTLDPIEPLFAPDQPYIGIKRFFRLRMEEEEYRKLVLARVAPVIPAPPDYTESFTMPEETRSKTPKVRARLGVQGYTKASVTRQVRQFKKEQVAVESYTLAETPDDRYYAKARYISQVHIRNFKAIEDLKISFREGTSSNASCLMMVGENGTGKSSVLQAIALTLLGETERKALGLDARDFVREGEKEGSVEVTFADSLSVPAILKFKSNSPDFTVENSSRVLMLGYGSTRLLPPKSKRRALKHTLNWNRANNLFDPYYALVDPAKWLDQLPLRRGDKTKKANKRQFILEDLSNLLLFKKDRPTDAIELKLGKDDEPYVSVTFGEHPMPLNRLSDGYKTMFALGADMMSVLAYLWPSPETAEGIVLIDEMGSHLHPQWKLRVVSLIRQAFPRVQFIMTTHDPLCLRGCGRNEVMVMEKQWMLPTEESPIPSYVVKATQDGLPDPAALRIDQILTSEFFGLRTTLDPEMDDMLDDYIRIKQLAEPSDAERQRLVEIEPRLQEATLLGQSTLQRWMLNKMLNQIDGEASEALDLDDDLQAFVAESWEKA